MYESLHFLFDVFYMLYYVTSIAERLPYLHLKMNVFNTVTESDLDSKIVQKNTLNNILMAFRQMSWSCRWNVDDSGEPTVLSGSVKPVQHVLQSQRVASAYTAFRRYNSVLLSIPVTTTGGWPWHLVKVYILYFDLSSSCKPRCLHKKTVCRAKPKCSICSK